MAVRRFLCAVLVGLAVACATPKPRIAPAPPTVVEPEFVLPTPPAKTKAPMIILTPVMPLEA